MAKVIRPFPRPADGRPRPCYVYVVGYPHAKFGHAIKVGMSIYPNLRVVEFQVGNPDPIQTYCLLRCEHQPIAREIEYRFHKTGLGNPIRGEWLACDPMEAMHYLTFIAAAVFQRRYRDKEVLRTIRQESGLHRICDELDRMPGYDRYQALFNERWGVMEGARRPYAR